ncbi:MAG: hypothetical protein JWM68_255 [Verrucomicrobiales bacterium]|nr:hypothetical protein [Verrucomicrobiales bacterium]
MKNPLLTSLSRSRLAKTLALNLALGALFSQAVQGAVDVVYVTSYTGASITPNPPFLKVAGTSYSPAGSGSFSMAPGLVTRAKTVYGWSSDLVFKVTPTLAVPGAIYKIETSHTSATTSTDVRVTLSSPDGDLTASCTNTSAFDAAHGQNGTTVPWAWQTIGYITNYTGVTAPAITFTVVSGTLGPTSSSARFYFDAFRFTEENPCSGVAADINVVGPLTNNQDYVNVTGVTAGATQISVFADASPTPIGQLTTGIVAGANQVPLTTPLAQGQLIKATQTFNGCSGTKAGGGIVGSGGNSPITAYLSCYSNSAFAGPVGVNTTTGLSTSHTIKGSGLSNGSNSAPTGGAPLTPSSCWQTITFLPTDPRETLNNGFQVTDPNRYSALDGLIFSISITAPDSGPYDLYIDQIKNGDVVIEDFESYPVGSTNTFAAPNTATLPAASSAYIAGGVNSSIISTANAFDGTKSCRIRWQFADADTARWARIPSATTGKRNPQIDNSKPVTIRYLMMPVGEVTNKLHFTSVPAARYTLLTNSAVTWNVAAAGEGGFTYLWKLDGNDIPGETLSSYTKSNVQLGDTGTYSVTVTGLDGGGCAATHESRLIVVDTVPVLTSAVVTTNITLSWSGPFTLQSATVIPNGTWTDLSTNTGFTQAISKTGNRFYRLKP